jgi:hypothetical protein
MDPLRGFSGSSTAAGAPNTKTSAARGACLNHLSALAPIGGPFANLARGARRHGRIPLFVAKEATVLMHGPDHAHSD